MIIKVTDAEIPTAAHIHSISWRASHRAFCSPQFIAQHTPAHQEAYIRQKMTEGSVFYMLLAPHPVGIVSIRASLIEDLYILPESQNRGFGTQLLRHAIGCCDGVPTLWILSNNHDAARLYEREGFQLTGNSSPITSQLNEIEYIMARPAICDPLA